MSKYSIHKAVEISALAESKRPSKEALNSLFYTWQPKIDGCNCISVVCDRQVKLFSRTGVEVLSADHLKPELNCLASGVYLGEYYVPGEEFATISGKFRHTKETFTEACLFIFDVLALPEWEVGYAPEWKIRSPRLNSIPKFSHVKPLPATNRKSAEMWIAQNPSIHCDGLIARYINGVWSKGSLGKNGEILKIKDIYSLDGRVTKIVTTTGGKTGRPVYTLHFEHEGTHSVVGSGVPHQVVDLPKVGDTIEVEFLGWTKKGMLREPRYKGIRTDS